MISISKEVGDYCDKVGKDIEKYLNSLLVSDDYLIYKYSKKGFIHPLERGKAHFTTAFTIRIALLSGIWEKWEISRREQMINYLKSFQNLEGFFADPWLKISPASYYKKYLFYLLGRIGKPTSLKKIQLLNLTAETRQDISIIIEGGSLPKYPPPLLLINKESVQSLFYSLDWSRPWASSSHFSHQIFFLYLNYKHYGMNKQKFDDIINHINEILVSIRNRENGAWYSGATSDYEKVNGAMKIFSALQWLEITYPNSSALIEYVLKSKIILDGCNFLNPLFVIFHCLKANPEYKDDKRIKAYVISAFNKLKSFRREDGGFSFYTNGAQKVYYGKNVSRGILESDLHGTMMIIWALSIIVEILNIDTENNWRVIKN